MVNIWLLHHSDAVFLYSYNTCITDLNLHIARGSVGDLETEQVQAADRGGENASAGVVAPPKVQVSVVKHQHVRLASRWCGYAMPLTKTCVEGNLLFL